MSILFGGSILVAFIAGMIALFAPCCISVLLPAYFASTFQNRRKIIGMTFIFGAGIATVIVPLVLGFSYVINLINAQHGLIYLIGGLFMLSLGVYLLLGGQFHMPVHSRRSNGKLGVKSIYSLGIFSGVASACCAPVLAGVLAISAFTASIGLVSLLGIAYVFGMVVPLLIMALLYSKIDLRKSRLFRPKSFRYRIGRFTRTLNGTTLASGLLLSVVGVISIRYGLTQDSMDQPANWQYQVTLALQRLSNFLTELLDFIPNAVTGLLLIGLLIIAIKITIKQFSSSETEGDTHEKKT